MEEILLQATRRDILGKQVKAMRRAGQVPAVLYGHGFDPTPITLDLREASRLLGHLAPSALVTIQMDGDKHLALVREKQRDFIRGTLKHVDFQVVSMKEKIRVEVSIIVKGESIAIKDYNGVLVMGMESVEVECLPQNLPESITADISSIKRVGESIKVHDLQIPAEVTILEDPNEIVVIVTSQAAEEVEEVAPAAAAAAGAEPEVIEKGKKEEEEEA